MAPCLPPHFDRRRAMILFATIATLALVASLSATTRGGPSPQGSSAPIYCWSSYDCDPEQYCLFDGCAAETGVCVPRPEACPGGWDPVCGCDGVTYSNGGYAAMRSEERRVGKECRS